MNAAFDPLPKALAAACLRLPRRLDFYLEPAPAALIGLNRKEQLKDLWAPVMLHLTVLTGRIAVTNQFSHRNLGRLDEFKLVPGLPWSIRSLEACDLLIIEDSLSLAQQRDKIAGFLPGARHVGGLILR